MSIQHLPPSHRRLLWCLLFCLLFPSTEPTNTLLATQWTSSGTALLFYILRRGLVDRLLVALVFWLWRLLLWLLLLLQQRLWHL